MSMMLAATNEKCEVIDTDEALGLEEVERSMPASMYILSIVVSKDVSTEDQSASVQAFATRSTSVKGFDEQQG